MPKRPVSVEAMRLRLAGLCSRTEQCSSDLRRQILRAGLTSAQAGEILSVLREGRFLDEARYAAAFASDKVRFAGWGTAKIRAALAAKHIPSDTIASALASIDRAEYIAAFKRSALAKARTLDLSDSADIQRLYRHLATRGYESSLIARAISRLKK